MRSRNTQSNTNRTVKNKKSFFKNVLIVIFTFLSINYMPVYADDFNARFYSYNDILYYDGGKDCDTSSGSGGGSLNLSGNDNVEKLWNYFKSKGLSDEQAAGALGGAWGETSGRFDPSMIQSGQKYDEATAMNPGVGAYAFGMFQWDTDRRVKLIQFARAQGKDWSDFETQVKYLDSELDGGEGSAMAQMKAASSIRDAAAIWVNGFERPAEWVRADRINEGETVGKELMSKFGGKSSSSSSSNSSSSSSNSSSTSTSSSTPNSSSKYSFIGDSITAGVKDKLSSTFGGSSVDAVVGRGITQGGQGGGSVMDYLNTNPSLEKIVVVNIGANDQFPEDAAKQMLDKIGKDKTIYLVNNYSKNGNTNYEVTNSHIQNVAKNYSNVKILDWKSYVDKNGGKDKLYSSDGVHPNEEGQNVYIKFLQENLGNGGNSSSSSSSCGGSSSGTFNGKFFASSEATRVTSDGFAIFAQGDPRWSNTPFGNGNYLGPQGCGPSSLATIISALSGKTVLPTEVAAKAGERGYTLAGAGTTLEVANIAKDYGLTNETIPNDVSAVNKELDSGNLVMVAGTGPGPFLNCSHWVTIRKKTDDGKWLIANSGRNDAGLDDIKYEPAEVMSMVMSGGTIAIRKG